jgi:hypothetical protein
MEHFYWLKGLAKTMLSTFPQQCEVIFRVCLVEMMHLADRGRRKTLNYLTKSLHQYHLEQ